MTDLTEIYAKLPHSGPMRLLEGVESWNETRIRCLTRSHRAPDNPLRGGEGLSSVHAVEYAAQAAAVHGVLRGTLAEAPVLFLAAVGALQLECRYLDAVGSKITIDAELDGHLGSSVRYRFALLGEERVRARGSITLMPGSGAGECGIAP